MRKKLKWLIDRIHDGREQYAELGILILVFFIPFFFDVQGNIDVKKPDNLDILKLFLYFALKHGNVGIGIGLIVLMLIILRQFNKDRSMNRGNLYHQHTMAWYSLCSYLLGYKTCNLTRVPIATRVKLVLRDAVEKCNYGSDAAYPEIDKAEDKIIIQQCRMSDDGKKQLKQTDASPSDAARGVTDDYAVNIAISDTYPIREDMLPAKCVTARPMFIIQRENNKKSQVRCYSPNLIHAVNDFVRKLPGVVEIHIFPTTNPKNTFRIVEDVFTTAGRYNLKKLYVHTQPNSSKGDWTFSDDGKRIYG